LYDLHDVSEGRETALIDETRGADAEQARRRHRALADPSRGRLLAELVREGPLDTRELARRVGLHPNTVRAHLGALHEAELVEVEAAPASGRGRPRRLFRAAESASGDASRRYRLLAEILTTLVARSGDRSAELEEVGEVWGHHLVDSPPPFAALSDDEARERLLALLEGVGFRPSFDEEGRIAMRPCPFLELARRHREVVCPIHLGLMRGALAELGASSTVSRLEAFAEPDLCVAHLAATRS
jgi:predicted ArsR family transcriptional regulator